MTPLSRPGPVRIGPHIHSTRAGDLAERWIREVRPPVVKWLHGGVDPALVALQRQQGGHALLRVYRPMERQTRGDLEDYLREVTDALRSYNGLFDMVEVTFNEQHQGGDDLSWKAEADIRGMIVAERLGVRAAIGAFSVGQPADLADWSRYLPALRYAAKGGHAVLIHEYGGPAMQWGCGSNQMSNLEGGRWARVDPARSPGVDGWFCLRYRKAVARWRALGIESIPWIIIGESGLDDIQPRPEMGPRRGWKTYHGMAPQALGDYADQLRWYAERLTEDPYILGAVEFGFADGSGKWDDFDLTTAPEMLGRVIDLQKRVAGPTVRPPAPQPPKEGPVKQYRVEEVGADNDSDRLGHRPRWLVLHSTASGASMDARETAQYLKTNTRGVSIHYTVGDGVVYRGVPEERAAHHCGGARLPDGTTGRDTRGGSWVDLANGVTIGVELFQTVGLPTEPAVLETGLALLLDICRRHQIPSQRVIGHREIDPSRRSDPVGVDMAHVRSWLRERLQEAPAAPPPAGVPAGLLEEARRRGRVALNPGAALYRKARALTLVPVSAEFDFAPDLVAQLAQGDDGRLRVLWVKKGDWGNVQSAPLP